VLDPFKLAFKYKYISHYWHGEGMMQIVILTPNSGPLTVYDTVALSKPPPSPYRQPEKGAAFS
jgi:hypothetical protein